VIRAALARRAASIRNSSSRWFSAGGLVLVDLDEDLPVGEAANRHGAQRLPQVLGHLLGERPVGRPGEEQQLAPREGEVRHVSPAK